MEPEDDLAFLRDHSAHDVAGLLKRWRDLAKRLKLQESSLGSDADQHVILLETGKSRPSPSIYLSAGVHGDEPAPLWGLLFWAEAELEKWIARGVAFTIFPCFNPHGVIENTRRNSEFVDLNRHFEKRTLPLIAAWQDRLVGRRYDLALSLHEDFDGRGVYIYELDREAENHSLARRCLIASDPILPRDTRTEIDGSDFENGLFARGSDEAAIRQVAEEELNGWPEAIYLFLNHSPRALTFETPSEFALMPRIRAHQLLVETAIDAVVA